MKQANLYNEDVKAALAAFELPWQQLSGKNILVLGATGLIGGCLVDMLMQHEGLDYQVYAASAIAAAPATMFRFRSRTPLAARWQTTTTKLSATVATSRFRWGCSRWCA